MKRNSFLVELYKWFSHPVVAFLGTLTGVIGLPLSFWFYYQSLPSRAMNVLEPPVRSVFVNHDVPAALQVLVNGEQISGKDVFAVQLAIWNNGNQSIRPENVLSPFTLVATDKTKIVDAAIIRKTRDVCGVSVSVLPGGESAQVDWKILEPQDGAIVQLVLVGNQTARIGLKGEIESGGRPRYVRLPAQQQPEQQLWSSGPSIADWAVYLGVPALSAVALLSLIVRELPKNWKRRRTAKGIGELVATTIGIAVCAWLTWAVGTTGFYVLTGRDRVPAVLVAPPASHEANR